MATKATHSGTCQLCGHDQKLPGGKLSIHGYTVQWHYFQGRCPGSKHLPYELSCDLITKRIPEVAEQIVELAERAKFVRADRETVRFERRIGRNYGDRQLRAFEALAQACSFENHTLSITVSVTEYAKTEPKTFQWASHELGYAGSLDEAIAYLNGCVADEIEHTVRKLGEYGQWLIAREKAWKLSELRPVVETPKGESKVCSYHGCRRHKVEGYSECWGHLSTEKRAAFRANR